MRLLSRKLIVSLMAMLLLVLDGTGIMDLGSVRGELAAVAVAYVVGQGAVDAAETVGSRRQSIHVDSVRRGDLG